MQAINEVMLSGIVFRKPQRREFANGTRAVTKLKLKTRPAPSFEMSRGDLCIVECEAFNLPGNKHVPGNNNLADIIADNIREGDQVAVTGFLKVQTWQGPNGVKNSKVLVGISSLKKLADEMDSQSMGDFSAPVKAGSTPA